MQPETTNNEKPWRQWKREAAVDDQLTAHVLKDFGQIVLEKLVTLYTHCFVTSNVPESLNNADITLILKKGHIRDMKNETDQLTVFCLKGVYKGNR